MFVSVLEQLFMLFAFTAMGLVAKKTGLMDKKLEKGLSHVMVTIALPCYIIALGAQDNDPQKMQGILWVSGVCVAFYLLFSLFSKGIANMLRVNPVERRNFVVASIFANVGFMGFPVISAFLPETGALYTAFGNMWYNFFFFTLGIRLLTGEKSEWRKILLNINILSIFTMAVLFLFQIKLPGFIQNTLSTMGGLCTPVSMLVIGSKIGDAKIRELFIDKTLYQCSALRLVVYPALIGILLRLLGAPIEAAITLTVLAAMPAGSLTVMATEQRGLDATFASRAVLHSTILFILTAPLLTWFIDFVFLH